MIEIQKTTTKKTSDLPLEAQKFLLRIDKDPELTVFKKKHKLNTSDSEALDEYIHMFFLQEINPVEFDDLVLNSMSLNEKESGDLVDDILTNFLPETLTRFKVKNTDFEEGVDETPNSTDVLKEIENPTLSIPNSPTVTPKTPLSVNSLAQKTISTASSGSTLQGFATTQTPPNPAEKVAQKLDAKLEAPASSEPVEVYQVKKPDPYRETF